MQFASYADFREKVRILIEGDEIGETFSTTTLDLIIGLAEQRIGRLRVAGQNPLCLRSAAIMTDLLKRDFREGSY